MKTIKIGKHLIGSGLPVFTIAEAGINHNGNFETAKQLVDEAVKAKASCIKIQTHFPDDEMLKDKQGAGYIGESFYNLLDRTKLSKEEQVQLKKYCEQKGILFLSTPFSREAADFLEQIGVDAFKIGSGELTNLPLVTHVAKKGKPVILSTGMSRLDEVENTLKHVLPLNDQIIVTQCTSLYPTPYENVNLGMIPLMRDKFKVWVGLSDHSVGVYTALGAVALGAVVLEKHFTCSRNWPGPDQKASIEPDELKMMVEGAEAIRLALGAEKKVLPGEVPVQHMARESVVSVAPIKKGDTLSEKNIWVKRPGTGIPAAELPKILGKKSKKEIAKDSLLTWEDFE